MRFPKTEAEWVERTSRHLKAELKRAGGYLRRTGNLLRKQGLKDETKGTVAYKLSRGIVTATFFLASLAAIGCEAIRQDDI
jgi:hypothetical protein